MELKFQGHFAPGSVSSREREGQGAKRPGSESSMERIGQGFIGRFAPGSEWVRERKGCESHMRFVATRAPLSRGNIAYATALRIIATNCMNTGLSPCTVIFYFTALILGPTSFQTTSRSVQPVLQGSL